MQLTPARNSHKQLFDFYKYLSKKLTFPKTAAVSSGKTLLL